MHSEGVMVLLFLVVSLLAGALIKAFLGGSKLPYTVILLLGGITLGTLNRNGLFGDGALEFGARSFVA